jgi:hypothetical protein
MCLAKSERGDPLHEIKQACWRSTFLMQHGLNDFAVSNLENPRLRQQTVAVLGAGDDPLAVIVVMDHPPIGLGLKRGAAPQPCPSARPG